MCIVYNDLQSIFEKHLLRNKSFSIHHQNIQRLLTEIHKVLQNIPANTYGNLCTRNSHNLNLRFRSEHKIPAIKSELKGKNSLRYNGSVTWNNLRYKMRNLENLSAFTAKIIKRKTDSCKCRRCKRCEDGLRFI